MNEVSSGGNPYQPVPSEPGKATGNRRFMLFFSFGLAIVLSGSIGYYVGLEHGHANGEEFGRTNGRADGVAAGWEQGWAAAIESTKKPHP